MKTRTLWILFFPSGFQAKICEFSSIWPRLMSNFRRGIRIFYPKIPYSSLLVAGRAATSTIWYKNGVITKSSKDHVSGVVFGVESIICIYKHSTSTLLVVTRPQIRSVDEKRESRTRLKSSIFFRFWVEFRYESVFDTHKVLTRTYECPRQVIQVIWGSHRHLSHHWSWLHLIQTTHDWF